MSTKAKIIEQFTQLIEKGQHLSHDEIAQRSLEMMQILANNPSVGGTWQSLKEGLQAIYDGLDDDKSTLCVPVEVHIHQKLRELAR